MYVYILNHNMSGLKDQALAIVMENLKLDMLEDMNTNYDPKTLDPKYAIVPFNYSFINTLKRKCRVDHSFCVLYATSKDLQAFNDKRTSLIRRQYIQYESYRNHCYNLINHKTVMLAICKEFCHFLPIHLQPHPYIDIIESVHFIEDTDSEGFDDSFIVCRLQECDAVVQTSHMAFETRLFNSKTVLFDKNSDGSKTKTDWNCPHSVQSAILELLKDKLEDVLQSFKHKYDLIAAE